MDMNQEQIQATVEDILGSNSIVYLELKTGPPPHYESRGIPSSV